MIYFTADTHFFHNNIIKHCDRPFAAQEEMNRVLIANWNAKVRKDDEIYIMGDLTLKGISYVNELVPKLNGKKYLIRGNHDLFTDKEGLTSDMFEWIKDYYELHYEGTMFTMRTILLPNGMKELEEQSTYMATFTQKTPIILKMR